MSIERAVWTSSTSLSHILQSYEQITNIPDKDTGFIGYQLAGDPAQVGCIIIVCFAFSSLKDPPTPPCGGVSMALEQFQGVVPSGRAL